MKTALYIALLNLLCALGACSTNYYEADGPPLPPTPIDTDSLLEHTTVSLVGERWLIYHYRLGPMGDLTDISDTLYFTDNASMTYNEWITSYALYPSASVYILSLDETPWGMLSGAFNSYNLQMGEAPGLPFSIITPGSTGGQVYLWMRRF
jgi:hypothetical protein